MRGSPLEGILQLPILCLRESPSLDLEGCCHWRGSSSTRAWGKSYTHGLAEFFKCLFYIVFCYSYGFRYTQLVFFVEFLDCIFVVTYFPLFFCGQAYICVYPVCVFAYSSHLHICLGMYELYAFFVDNLAQFFLIFWIIISRFQIFFIWYR